MGSTAAGAMLGDLRFGSEADRALHGHIKHVLRAIEDHPRIGAYLKARFPDDLRHAFEQLMREAKESPGAFEIPPEREEGSGPSVAGPDMVRIPAGKFMMGVPQEESDGPEGWGASDDDSRPVHEVTFARPFLLGKYPVTVGEYAAFAGDTGRTPEPPAFPQTDRHPAVNVSFAGAVAYTEWLSERTGLRYRLPSEAEWEYACRAGTTTARWWGDGFDPSKANKNDQGTTAVDHYDPNPWGLHDTIGNVFEWVADPMHDNYVDAPSDGSVWTTGGSDDSRVVRGGSWDNGVRVLRSGYRYWNLDGARPWVGFRLASTPPCQSRVGQGPVGSAEVAFRGCHDDKGCKWFDPGAPGACPGSSMDDRRRNFPRAPGRPGVCHLRSFAVSLWQAEEPVHWSGPRIGTANERKFPVAETNRG